MAWKEGEKIGQYVLGKQLGQGGMATVYLAHHQHLDREVAVKVMHQNFLEDAGFVARFKREAQIVAKLSHPHIVPVYDFDEHEGLPYLVMKYVQGKTLKQEMTDTPLNVARILYVMGAVGSALTYAHREGVLHRDIKPSNIVIDKDDTPYLTDFGLARLASMGESTMSADMLLGTPHYISPEQARGAKDLDGRTDIYSLGVVLYELLVGHVPYTGDTPYSIIHDHIYSPLPMPSKMNPEIPPAVEMVLYKALEKKPEDRYATADDLVKDLRDALEESHLTDLSPNRSSAAAVSLAKNREDIENQLTMTPSPAGVASPFPNSSSNVRVATIQKNKNSPENTRIWPIGGCASLLLIVFAALGILLNMSQNILELSAMNNGELDVAPNLSIFGMAALPEQYREMGVVMLDSEFPSIMIPDVPLERIPESPLDPIGFLLRARGLYAQDDFAGAREAIVTGAPDENVAIYLVTASQLAADAGDTQAALILSIAAVESARQESPALFNAIRPRAGEFIYQTAGTTERVDMAATLEELRGNGLISDETINRIGDSPIALFTSARNLIINGNYLLARRALNNAPENNPLEAEFLLLQGELAIATDEPDAARGFLEAIDDLDDVPQWIEDQADDLLETLD